MATPTKTLFPEELVKDLFSKVGGKSTLAKLSKSTPIEFVGSNVFTFSMDKDVDIVAENGKHTEGGVTIAPVSMMPIKFEYGARVSEEFLTATEEEQLAFLEKFNEGFAKKLAKGLDIAAMHGFNPRTNTASDVVSTNHFDSKVTNHVAYAEATVDQNLTDAIAMVESHEGEVNGIAMSKVLAAAMAKVNKGADYPEFKLGGCPTELNGMAIDSNITVSKGPATYPDHAIVGDFENAFKWGFGKDIKFQVIEYGDPDNSGKDLKGYGQVYLRAEAYLGWGILAPEYFARVVVEAA